MDTLVGIMLTEINQTEKGKYCKVALISGILKIQLLTVTKKKQTHRFREQIVVTSGDMQRGNI